MPIKQMQVLGRVELLTTEEAAKFSDLGMNRPRLL
jgi:hypothetical protein